jgi:hypothetical protein
MCEKIFNGYICFANTTFECPYCNKIYDDLNDKYLNRINNNKSFCTIIKCSCKEKFGLTGDFKGDYVTFKNK